MKFTETYRISSHDFAHNNCMRPSAVLRYMMETANRNMYVQKPSYSELLAQGYAFLVGRTHLCIYADVQAYDTVTVETWAIPEKGASFDRCYRLLKDGEVVAEAYCVFGLLNLHEKRLCRAGEVDLSYYTDEPLAISTRFRLPDREMTVVGEREIRYADTDCNAHMNNTNYPDMLCDFIPEIDQVRVTDVQIAFVSEAPLGERLTVKMGRCEDADKTVFAFETLRADGSVNIRALIETQKAAPPAGI